MWYMWISAQFYNGQFALPSEGQSWKDFIIDDLFSKWVEYGIPSFGSGHFSLGLF